MKINPTGIPNYITGKRRVNSFDEAYTKTSGLTSGDELAVSADVMSFAKVYSAMKEAYPAATASEPSRVADIAAKIKDGSYFVDSEAIASSILGDIYG